MRTTRDLKRLTNLTNLLLAGALALACAAAPQARQVEGRGLRPAPSVASLLGALKGEDARAREGAVEELRRIGQAAVPALTEFLNKEKGSGRAYAAKALAGIEPKNALARQTLEDIARAGKGDEVIEAAWALGEIDPENDAAVPTLVKMASQTFLIPSQKNMGRQRGAAFALAHTAPGIRALTPLLSHWDSWVREAAVFALDDLTETLRYATPSKRAAVKEAIPALVKALADKDKIVRGMAAEDLEQIGADAVPELKKAAAGGDKKLARAAAELLEQMGQG